MIITVVLAGIGGLIYGSFLNVLLWRLPAGERVGGRSHCRSCHHLLAWYDLFPVLSFVALGGRCRYCHTSIHVRYPLVEIGTAIVLAFFFVIRQPSLGLEVFMTGFALLVLVSLLFFDLFYFVLPDALLLPAVIVYAIYDIVKAANPLSYFLTALLSAGFFAILYLASRGKNIGFGDVKFALFIGLVLGYPFGFLAIVGGIWLAAIVSVILLVLDKVSLQDAIPLGSFLALSTIICIIFYYEILPLTIFF